MSARRVSPPLPFRRGGAARDSVHSQGVIASWRRPPGWLPLLALLLLGVAPASRAQVPPVRLDLVVGGLSSPLYVTHARDGSGRLFIVERGGRIKVLQPGATAPTVFLDISSRVLAGGERGLLGLAFHPQYPATGRFFVNYTRQPDGDTVIAEYRVSPTDPNVAGTAETVLLTVFQPFSNHNGGMVQFGPDGFLYIALGDGGSGNDPGNRAQNPDELLGKILRIDVNGSSAGLPYGIPADNPFAGPVPGRDEIYALGLRNPFRFAFDRATGDLVAADVGQNEREEIDVIVRGGNYGWRVFEGTRCTGNGPGACDPAAFTPPIAEYDHSLGRCSITGGYVYRGALSTLPAGAYVFGDFCTGEIFLLQGSAISVLLDTTLGISSFGEDAAGEVYVVALGGTPPPRAGCDGHPHAVAAVRRLRGDPGLRPRPDCRRRRHHHGRERHPERRRRQRDARGLPRPGRARRRRDDPALPGPRRPAPRRRHPRAERHADLRRRHQRHAKRDLADPREHGALRPAGGGDWPRVRPSPRADPERPGASIPRSVAWPAGHQHRGFSVLIDVLPVPHAVQDNLLPDHVVTGAVGPDFEAPPADAFAFELLDLRRRTEGVGLDALQGIEHPRLSCDGEGLEVTPEARRDSNREGDRHSSAPVNKWRPDF